MLDTVVMSGDDVCCSVVFGTLVGVFVFSVMWSELLMTSAISCPLWSSVYECQRGQLVDPQIKGRGHNEVIKKMPQPWQNVSRQKFIQEMLIYNILEKNMHIHPHIGPTLIPKIGVYLPY